MKKLLLLLYLVCTLTAYAQEEKTVTLVVSGQGKTQDEARQKALRSAIEQAFGTFISSKTEILNDNLVKDEIVSVASGNIQKFEPVSEVQLPDGGYAATLKATVSVTKLTSFCESKGVEVEFKGALFAMNIKLQKLNEEAEYKAILDLCKVSKDILSKGLDYSLKVSEPVAYKGSADQFSIKFEVNCSVNKNFEIFENYFWNTLPKIALSKEEKLNYDKIQKPVSFIIKSNSQTNSIDTAGIYIFDYYYDSRASNLAYRKRLTPIFLRNPKSLLALKNLMIKSNDNLLNFRIISEVDTIVVKKCCYNYSDSKLTTNNLGNWSLKGGYPASSTCGNLKKNDAFLGFFIDHDSGTRFYSTWNIYRYFISNSTNIENLKILFDENTYLTTTGSELKKNTKLMNEGYGYLDYLTLFDPYSRYTIGDPIVLYDKSSPTSFDLKYEHIISLEKLEKISKYKIEPWENKTY